MLRILPFLKGIVRAVRRNLFDQAPPFPCNEVYQPGINILIGNPVDPYFPEVGHEKHFHHAPGMFLIGRWQCFPGQPLFQVLAVFRKITFSGKSLDKLKFRGLLSFQ
jgi:hypothetical protein